MPLSDLCVQEKKPPQTPSNWRSHSTSKLKVQNMGCERVLFINMCSESQSGHFICKSKAQGDIVFFFFSADTQSSSLARLILKTTNNRDNLNGTIEREAALVWGELFGKIIHC